jgi:hypothetical protein
MLVSPYRPAVHSTITTAVCGYVPAPAAVFAFAFFAFSFGGT